MRYLRFILFFLALLPTCKVGRAGEIIFWHSFTGSLEEKLKQLVRAFELTAPDVKVKLVYKGDYTQAFGAFKQAALKPHILQVAEYQFETLKNQPDQYRAVDELLDVKSRDFPLYVSGFYGRDDGRLLALPFNVSTGVMFINWDAWQNAGLSEQDVPKTWVDFESTLKKLRHGGVGKFSTAWPAAYVIEHFAAQCGLQLQQGPRLDFSHPALIEHLKRFSRLAAENCYVYGGRYGDAESLFTRGNVAIFLQGANRHQDLMEKSSFAIRAFPLPFDHTLVRKPYALPIGGASLWTPAGHTDAAYGEVKKFFAFLLKAETQASWFEQTNYLPTTHQGVREVEKRRKSTEASSPGFVALSQALASRTLSSDGVHVQHYAGKRAKIMDGIESVLSGKENARNALLRVTCQVNADL